MWMCQMCAIPHLMKIKISHDFLVLPKVKVKVLVYSLVLAAAAIHTTLQASHYLLVRELH